MELRLFGQTMQNMMHRFVLGEPILVKASYQAARYNPNFIDMNIQEISNLNDIKGKTANNVTVMIERDQDCSALNDLLAKYWIDKNNTEGRPGTLTIQIRDEQRKQVVKVKARKPIDLNRQFMEELEDLGYASHVV